uniref:Uncharacterized protein n=1 Tax=Glossina brevipalpis TaxID=37001 RepID=A0A1A9WCL7_9MUSC
MSTLLLLLLVPSIVVPADGSIGIVVCVFVFLFPVVIYFNFILFSGNNNNSKINNSNNGIGGKKSCLVIAPTGRLLERKMLDTSLKD